MPRHRVRGHSVDALVGRADGRRGCSFLLATLALALLAATPGHGAQQPTKGGRVGYLSLQAGPFPRSEALHEGLRELGYVEGQNLTMVYRWAQGNLDRLRQFAAELAHIPVDVIVTAAPTATRTAKEATATVPIVMAFDADPVGAGFVARGRGRCIRGIPTSDARGPVPERPCRLDASPACGLASPIPCGRPRCAGRLVHHVINRGLERRAMFGDDRDRAAAGPWDPLLKHT